MRVGFYLQGERDEVGDAGGGTLIVALVLIPTFNLTPETGLFAFWVVLFLRQQR